MNDSYVLGKNKTRFEIAEFPKIDSNEKIGILFQGGIESTLLALMAKEIYGIDNVVFILITANAVLGYKNDSNKLDILRKTFQDSVDNIGGTHTIELGDDALNRHNLSNSALKKLVSKYGSKIKFVLAGYNKVYEESVNLLKDSGWSRGFITNDKLDGYLEQNSKKYPELYNHVKKQNGKIFGVSKHIGFEQISTDYHTNVRPFRNLNLSEIIDLYGKLNLISYLYKTSSCDVDLGNCGICDNCHRRKSAFQDSSVSDLTKYTFN
jgi:hypothetical protein